MSSIEQSTKIVYFDESFGRVNFDKIKPRYVIGEADNSAYMSLWTFIGEFLDTQSAMTLRYVSRSLYNISLHIVPLTIRSVRLADQIAVMKFQNFLADLQPNERIQIESLTLPSSHDQEEHLYMHELEQYFSKEQLLHLARHSPYLVRLTNRLQLEGSRWRSFHKAYELCFSLIRHLDLSNMVPLVPYVDRPGQFLFFEVTYYFRMFQYLESLNLMRSAIVSRDSFQDLEKSTIIYLRHINLAHTHLNGAALQRFLRFPINLITLNLRYAGSEIDSCSYRTSGLEGIRECFYLVFKDQFPKLKEVDLTGTNVSVKDVRLLLMAAPNLSILKLPQTAELDRFLYEMPQEIYRRFDKLYYNDALITPKKLQELQSYLKKSTEINLRASL